MHTMHTSLLHSHISTMIHIAHYRFPCTITTVRAQLYNPYTWHTYHTPILLSFISIYLHPYISFVHTQTNTGPLKLALQSLIDRSDKSPSLDSLPTGLSSTLVYRPTTASRSVFSPLFAVFLLDNIPAS